MSNADNGLGRDPWNDSLSEEYLWSNVNFGEAVTEVMTPLSWTVLKLIFGQWVFLPGYDSVGNIGGRPYLNISLFVSVMQAVGRNRQQQLETLEGTMYMRLPEELEIPTIPLSKRSLPAILLAAARSRIQESKGTRGLPGYLASNSERCADLRRRIRAARTKDELLTLWQHQILPHVTRSVWHVMGSVSTSTQHTMRLRRALEARVGPDDAQKLIANVSERSEPLASLGPLVGIARLASCQMSRQAYLDQFGHRGPHEFELSVPRPIEDPEWLDSELARFREHPVALEDQMAKQREGFAAAWNRFVARYPIQAPFMRRRIERAARWARMREAARSEYVRDRWLTRALALRAGELTGLGDDVFFLALDEMLDHLSGNQAPLEAINARKDTYARYRALPAYPSIIVGHFDPFTWAANPGRQTDLFDARAAIPDTKAGLPEPGLIRGSPGSAGRLEGTVRRLDRPEDGGQLQAGEVLVTRHTDVAWTLLFPRAAAVITDVGAPLSHAAIVARELGIPAVVGCGDATGRLRTGDRVLVDGGRGIVEIVGKR